MSNKPTPNASYSSTLRVKIQNSPGKLGEITTAIGRVGGDIVVALTNKRIVLKRFYREGANVELRPANNKYLTIKLPANKIEILGVYRGLIRPLI